MQTILPSWVEFFPVVIALVTMFFASKAMMMAKGIHKIPHAVTLVSSVFLAFLQIRWFQALHLDKNLTDTLWVAASWTIFNSLIMVSGMTYAMIDIKRHENNTKTH